MIADAIDRSSIIVGKRFAHSQIEPEVTGIIHSLERAKEFVPVDGTVADGEMLRVGRIVVGDMNIRKFSLQLRQSEDDVFTLRGKVPGIEIGLEIGTVDVLDES